MPATRAVDSSPCPATTRAALARAFVTAVALAAAAVPGLGQTLTPSAGAPPDILTEDGAVGPSDQAADFDPTHALEMQRIDWGSNRARVDRILALPEVLQTDLTLPPNAVRGETEPRTCSIAAAMAACRGSAAACDQLEQQIAAQLPVSWEHFGAEISALARCGHVRSDDWTPAASESAAGRGDDGMIDDVTGTLKRGDDGSPYWKRLDEDPEVLLIAAIFFADLSAVLRAERDLPWYLTDAYKCAEYPYMRAELRPGSYVSAVDESGTRVSGYVASFQIDGPFAVNPLVELKFREQITPRGEVTATYYSDSADTQYYAGIDRLIPLVERDGTVTACLDVTVLTYELSGLAELGPDRAARRAQLRQTIGNWKRHAEGR